MDGIILEATCRKCNHIWIPFGNKMFITPHRANVKCPNCESKLDITWDDVETKKLKRQQELGLIQPSSELDLLKQKFSLLEQKFSLLEQKLSLEEQKSSTAENEIQILKAWASQREDDFRIIEDNAKAIEEEEKFKEDNR